MASVFTFNVVFIKVSNIYANYFKELEFRVVLVDKHNKISLFLNVEG